MKWILGNIYAFWLLLYMISYKASCGLLCFISSSTCAIWGNRIQLGSEELSVRTFLFYKLISEYKFPICWNHLLLVNSWIVHAMSLSNFCCLDLNPLPQKLSLKFAILAITCFKLLCERAFNQTFGAPHHWVSFLGPLSLQEDIYFYIAEITFFLLSSFYFLRKKLYKIYSIFSLYKSNDIIKLSWVLFLQNLKINAFSISLTNALALKTQF